MTTQFRISINHPSGLSVHICSYVMILIAKYIILDPSTRITNKTPYIISPVFSGGPPAAQETPKKVEKDKKGKGENEVKKIRERKGVPSLRNSPLEKFV